MEDREPQNQQEQGETSATARCVCGHSTVQHFACGGFSCMVCSCPKLRIAGSHLLAVKA